MTVWFLKIFLVVCYFDLKLIFSITGCNTLLPCKSVSQFKKAEL